MEREVPTSSPWYPMTKCAGMLSSCIKGGSERTSGSFFFFYQEVGQTLVKRSRLPRGLVSDASLLMFKRHHNNTLNNML